MYLKHLQSLYLIHSNQRYTQQKTAPANMDANQPEIAVITGFNEFLIAWFFIISYSDISLSSGSSYKILTQKI